ncbi:LexA family protein [Pandoraea sp. NPDC090278]|uniref:LexA family protein n=1 Tax=Pandoraea sp. NPDC090278 TaxID=3364391 RepID=UPI003839D612
MSIDGIGADNLCVTMNSTRDVESPVTRAHDGLAARIAEVLAAEGVSPGQFEAEVGLHAGATAAWLSREVTDIAHDQAARIQERYRFNMFWLITGRGKQRIPSLHAQHAKPSPKFLNAYPPESFPARLKYAMDLRGIRQKQEVAQAGGVTAAAVHLWFSGGKAQIEANQIEALSRFLRVEPEWLRDGIGPMEGAANVRLAEVGTRRIPLISSIQAGLMNETVTPFPPGAGFEYLLTDLVLSDGAFALEIDGRSMEPEFREGDRIIVDPILSPIPGDYVVATNARNEATFKKYRPRGLGPEGMEVFDLVPLNPDFPTIHSEQEQARVVGVMIEHRRYRQRK